MTVIVVWGYILTLHLLCRLSISPRSLWWERRWWDERLLVPCGKNMQVWYVTSRHFLIYYFVTILSFQKLHCSFVCNIFYVTSSRLACKIMFVVLCFLSQPVKQQHRPGAVQVSSPLQPRASLGWVCKRRSKSWTSPHSLLRRFRRYKHTISLYHAGESGSPAILFGRSFHSTFMWKDSWPSINMINIFPLPCVCVSLFQNYEHLFKVNDKSVGGSFYLQSKVSNPHVRMRDIQLSPKHRRSESKWITW